MKESKTLILIDGHALAFRQYYALERTNMQTNDGTPTWAVYGFFKSIFDLLKNDDLNADAIGVAFDVSHKTFRTEKFEEYKANRVAMPDSMRVQMDLIYEGLKAFNIPIYTKEGYEADDVIGTISKRACESGHKVYILTGDQDSFQLIQKNGCIKVIIPSKGELKEYDWDAVYDKLGVYPNQVIDYKALRGDTSDNIPGIKGIGEKTAVKLLSEFKTVDSVLDNIDIVQGNSIKEKLKNGIEVAKLSKFLATIVCDVDIPFDFEKTGIVVPDISDVTDFLRKMQFYSFLKNIEFILKSFNKSDEDLTNMQVSLFNDSANISQNGQLGLFAQAVRTEINKDDETYSCKLITDTADFEQMVKNLSENSLIAFKVFADVKDPLNFTLYGISFAFNKKFIAEPDLKITEVSSSEVSYYIPLNHNIVNQLPLDFVMNGLKSLMENFSVKKITHDIKTEYNIFKNFDIVINGTVFDTMLASYIKDSNASTVLDIQCMENINHVLISMVSENNKMKFSDYEIDFVKNYAADTINCLFKLTEYWLAALDEKELKILNEIEMPLAYVLSQMEFCGVSVDVNYLDSLSDEFDRKMSKLESKIYNLADEGFNINSPRQVGSILFDKLQLKNPKKRGKLKKSTSAEVLEALAEDYEIARLILNYRKYSKLKSTYTDILPSLIDSKDNRIHTTFNQTITATGRLSSSNPNLQNIPIRTEEGNKIRQAFVPADRQNYLILSADYSQIELRLLAHVSKDENLINAFNSGIDVHTVTASKVFDIPISSVTKDMRYKAKAVNFGIVYGQSKYGLAKSLKITPDEAEIFIKKYFDTYPRIREYMNAMVEFVEENGYVETIFGRRRYLKNEINNPNAMVREFAKRAAINQPMQGSAADLIKVAMIDFSNKLKDNNLKSKMIMQVHDELIVEVEKSEIELVKKFIVESMELSQPLRVPLLVDVNTGESWKES